jgi:phospholipid/cholesterol/gamma-HCH transport system ATP-binding protein
MIMPNTNKPLIEINGLGTCFDNNWVHKDLNLKIYPERTIAIIGDSGCGKTTLVREILMLQAIAEGEILLMGEKISDLGLDPIKSKLFASQMGMMFQHGALFSSLTVLENVMFPLTEYTDFSKATIADIARVKLALTGLATDAYNKFPSELSGGMLKRTALARTLALDPHIVFLDEPSAGLDPNGAYKLDLLIKNLQETLNLTVIMITHDLETIWNIVDEVIYLGDKRVLVHDTVENAAKMTEFKTLYQFFNGPRGKSAQQFGKKLRGDTANEHE